MNYEKFAPGWPGIPARWTSSSKIGVGTALNKASEVWFSISHGILNEIYYPRLDQACTRDMGMIVTDGANYFSEEKREVKSKLEFLSEGVPAYRLTNTSKDGVYEIVKEFIADPYRDCIIQKTTFNRLSKEITDLHLYAILAPHLGDRGSGNSAWVGDYKGTKMIFAQRDGIALAFASSAGWKNRSVGFAGKQDGWHDLYENKQLTNIYERAENGNVAITGEIDLEEIDSNSFMLIIGFGQNWQEAGQRALASLIDGYKILKKQYIKEWEKWQKNVLSLKNDNKASRDLYRISAAVLRIHEAKRLPGGLIASLSIPWGFAKGDDDLGGYHLVWPRDLVESAGGLIAVGAMDDAKRVLKYLMLTQELDGHWAQNMWLDGTPYWPGVQMDETAFPILLLDLARRKGTLKNKDIKKYWPMIKKASSYLVCNGPVTQQDRWEEDPGFSPFTLAVEIAALLAAAELANICGEPELSAYLEDTADTWNDNIERWTYATGNDWSKELEVEGYYVRIAPPDQAEAASTLNGFVPVKNRPPGEDATSAEHLVSPDALALVRFGLRAYNDEKIINTIKVIDAKLKVETQFGPAWHRYNGDGWGEHEDGSHFDGTGIGRVWPLLTGERAHYEIIAGNLDKAKELMKTVEAFSNEGGMLPEQIWDSEDIPERELYFGRPAGSAMPLVWAHSEYIKLRRSLRDKEVFDMPPQTFKRYVKGNKKSNYAIWRFNNKCRSIPAGKKLRIETLANTKVHWSVNDWKSTNDDLSKDSGLGIFVTDLPTSNFSPGDKVNFTFYWVQANKWEGENFTVKIE